MNQSINQQDKAAQIAEQNLREHYEEFLQFELLKQHNFCILYAAISSDQKFMATQDSVYRVLLWDFQNNRPLKYCEVSQHSITQMLFTENSKYLIITNWQVYPPYEIQIFQVYSENTKPFVILNDHTFGVSNIALTIDSKYLLSGGQDQQIILWDLNDFQRVSSYKVSQKIAEIAIANNSLLFACVCRKGQGYLFKSKSKTDLNPYQILKWKVNSTSYSFCVLFTQDSSKLIIYNGKELKIWGIANFRVRLIRKIKYLQARPYCGQLVVLNDKAISTYFKDQFDFWDIETGIQFKVAKSIGQQIFAITKDANYIISRFGLSNFKVYKRKVFD